MRELLADEFPFAAPFLVRTGSRVSSYPRLGGRSGPPLELVDEGQQIVAVDPIGGPPQLLLESNVLAYRIDLRKLSRCLCNAFGFELDTSPDQTGHCRRIGAHRPTTTSRCPVYFSFGQDSASQLDAIHRLIAQARDPVVLLTPLHLDDVAAETMLRHHPALHLPMCDTVAFNKHGRISAVSPADRLLNDFSIAVRSCENRSVAQSGRERDNDALVERARALKEMERCALQALAEKKVFGNQAPNQPSQEQLSKWAGYSYDTSFKTAMSTLKKSGFVDNGRHHGRRGGYFLTEDGQRAAEILSKS